jgi:hypothetical protein
VRVLTAILLAAVLAVLGVVAYDLHRVANVLEVTSGVGVHTAALTREQRREQNEALARETDEFLQDITATPTAKSRTPAKPH